MKNGTGYFCTLFLALAVTDPSLLWAHEEGAPFSGAILDPVLLHHAHIENEQRLNFFALNGVPDVNGVKHSGYESEFELAYGSRNYRYGFELFLPVENMAAPDGQGRVTGLGDMEIRPLKYALLMQPDFVISTASGFGLPTGSKSDGLGGGNTSFTQYLFADKASGNFSVTVNLGVGGNVFGVDDRWLDYGVGLAYSFIHGVRFGDVAPARPAQKWVVAPSLELLGEYSFHTIGLGQHTTSLAPGISFWRVHSGWQIRIGAQFPVAGRREADSVFTFQIGNHLNWKALLRGRGDEAL
jgi:hypothetical protein